MGFFRVLLEALRSFFGFLNFCPHLIIPITQIEVSPSVDKRDLHCK